MFCFLAEDRNSVFESTNVNLLKSVNQDILCHSAVKVCQVVLCENTAKRTRGCRASTAFKSKTID